MLTLVYSSCLCAATDPETASDYRVKPLVKGRHSMVVTNNKWATRAAQTMLNKGGNAVDAAIAAGFVLGLTEPQSSGIGGGGYALVFTKKPYQLQAYDGRETAPHSAQPDVQIAIPSPQAIAVPAEVALFVQLHHDHGKLPWKTLLKPAIDLAEHGFPMSHRLNLLLNTEKNILINSTEVRDVYFTGTNIKPIGSIVINKPYAATLRTLSEDPSLFYRGKLANEIIAAINNAAGTELYNKKDLADYSVIIHPALCSQYRKHYRICSVPPSSAGGATMQELMGIYALNYNGHAFSSSQWMYQFLEASKLAFADRNRYLADPAFVKAPLPGLLAKDYLKKRSQLIKTTALKTPVTAGTPPGAPHEYAPDAAIKQPGTTSIAIVDKNGNAISMTVTVENKFGSHLFTHGFFLNNQMTDFSIPSHAADGKLIANRIEPGKRPRSSITPTMVFNLHHKLEAISGSPGGSYIICYIAKNLIQMLDMGMKPDAASASPNLCAINADPVVETYRKAIPQITALTKKGEVIARSDMVSGVTNILRNPAGGWYGAADPRREGVALGH